jgi:hypothetical protein
VRKSITLGSIIAPLAPPTIWIIYFIISPNPDYEKYGSFEMSFMIFGCIILFWYIACLVLGIILFKILRKIHRLTFLWLVVTSTLLGSGVFSSFLLLLLMSGEVLIWKDVVFVLTVGALFGFITSGVFCALSGITTRSSKDALTRAA